MHGTHDNGQNKNNNVMILQYPKKFIGRSNGGTQHDLAGG